MTVIESIILGITQGLTEFLPISSSGHLVLMQHLLGIEISGNEFEILVHLGTLGSVLIVFFKDIELIISNYKSKKNQLYIFYLFIASLPAAFAGLFFKDYLKLFFDDHLIVSKALMFTGIILILSYFFKSSNKSLNIRSSVIIGFFQALAIIPGISRSGMTISLSIMMGINAKVAAKFSFLMAIPVIGGAGFLTFLDSVNDFSISFPEGCAALLSSFTVGILALKWLLNWLGKGKFHYFGIYCIIISLLSHINS